MLLTDSADWQRQITLNTEVSDAIPVSGEAKPEPIYMFDHYQNIPDTWGMVYVEFEGYDNSWVIQKVTFHNATNNTGLVRLQLWTDGDNLTLMRTPSLAEDVSLIVNGPFIVLGGFSIEVYYSGATIGDDLKLDVIGYKR